MAAMGAWEQRLEQRRAAARKGWETRLQKAFEQGISEEEYKKQISQRLQEGRRRKKEEREQARREQEAAYIVENLKDEVSFGDNQGVADFFVELIDELVANECVIEIAERYIEKKGEVDQAGYDALYDSSVEVVFDSVYVWVEDMLSSIAGSSAYSMEIYTAVTDERNLCVTNRYLYSDGR